MTKNRESPGETGRVGRSVVGEGRNRKPISSFSVFNCLCINNSQSETGHSAALCRAMSFRFLQAEGEI